MSQLQMEFTQNTPLNQFEPIGGQCWSIIGTSGVMKDDQPKPERKCPKHVSHWKPAIKLVIANFVSVL